ncbi:MAG: fimbrillin family protein, partial [Bacteroides sp.]|nr:fimbrillin family protein [Bacteroides sp.]
MKTYQYIALAALALSFAACTQEDDFTPQGNQKDTPLAIASAGVAELTTRATINNDRLEEGSIGVYVYSTTGDSYKGDNIKWTYRNGFWELDAETVVLFENNGNKQQIAAYYPYAEPTEGKVQITLPEAYGDDYDNYDYLYGEYAPLTRNPAAIKMKHLMAKVTVNVTTGTDIDAGDGVKSVELVGVPRTADWTLPDVRLSNYGTNADIALYSKGSAYCGYALPNEAESLALRITTDSGRLFTLTVLLDNAETTDDTEVLSSGIHYTIS